MTQRKSVSRGSQSRIQGNRTSVRSAWSRAAKTPAQCFAVTIPTAQSPVLTRRPRATSMSPWMIPGRSPIRVTARPAETLSARASTIAFMVSRSIGRGSDLIPARLVVGIFVKLLAAAVELDGAALRAHVNLEFLRGPATLPAVVAVAQAVPLFAQQK